MSSDAVAALQDDLDVLAPEDIKPLRIPASVLIDEARALAQRLLDDAELRAPLESLGIDEDFLNKTLTIVAAAEESEADLEKTAAEVDGTAWADLEQEAISFRAEVIAAARYHLRHHEHMLAEVLEFLEGEGASDLILDLDTLARFIRASRRLFRGDDTFDADARATHARELARQLREHMHDEPGMRRYDQARQRRNRVFTLLRHNLLEMRAAGQYRYWNFEELLATFLSDYRRSHIV